MFVFVAVKTLWFPLLKTDGYGYAYTGLQLPLQCSR